MFYVSDIYSTIPSQFHTNLQKKTHEALQQLQIPFARVETDEAITMGDCVLIDAKLDMKMVKTLFLCNRQKSTFYLFITMGSKPFRAKDFSSAIDVARVSFAPANLMEQILGTKIGAVTVFSALVDTQNAVQIVFDREVLAQEWYGCSDGTTTGYIKIKTDLILHSLLPFTRHTPAIIEV